MPVFNYGFRHTLPRERQNLAVLGPASGFGGLGTTAGRIVEFNVGVGEGLAIAVAKAIAENRSLQTIANQEVRSALGYTPPIYGYRTDSFRAVSTLERRYRLIDYEENYLNRAQAFFETGSYSEAADELSRAITLDPQNAKAYYLRGNSLFNLKALDLAIADYSEAIRLDPALMEAYLYRGYLNIFNDNYDLAISDFEQALQLDPAFAGDSWRRTLTRSFLQAGATDDSWYTAVLPWLDRAIQQQPEFATAYVIRGIARAESGNAEQARADLEQAIALYRAQGDAHSVSNAQGTLDTLLN